MLSFFTSKKAEIKGFKVCMNSDRQRKYGIASGSLKVLRQKINEKFKLDDNFEIYFNDCLVADDEYFNSIPNQSNIVVVLVEEDYRTDTEIIIDLFRKINEETFHARDLIKEFLVNNSNQDALNGIIDIYCKIDEKTKASEKSQHPEWFSDGIKFSTKEEVLRSKARHRIKGYFFKTQDALTKSLIYKSNLTAHKVIDELLTDFHLYLNGTNYFECLFDRTHDKRHAHSKISDEIDAKAFKNVKRRRIDQETKEKIKRTEIFEKFQVSLCNDIGSFNCHGVWEDPSCKYEHKINPYSSKEALLLFQIYNLDHQAEISRTIFPSILRGVEKLCEGTHNCESHGKVAVGLSTLTYFYEIFTVKNLKLVHIVCHDKGEHKVKSNGRLICEDCKEFKLIKKIRLRVL